LKGATTPSPRDKTRHELDSEKKKMIMEWMERTGNAPTAVAPSEQPIVTRSMKDDEEALMSYAQTPSKELISMNEQFADNAWNCDGAAGDDRLSAGMGAGEGGESMLDGDGIVGHIEHPLSILSLDKTSASTSAKSSSENV
uniref:Remorin_C domain-containing protein n=1 Tax=Anisakis simplex TaxID=6269 RepID=A0A0M3KIM5_ANISI